MATTSDTKSGNKSEIKLDNSNTINFRIESNSFPSEYACASYDSARKTFTITQLETPNKTKKTTICFTFTFNMEEEKKTTTTTTSTTTKT